MRHMATNRLVAPIALGFAAQYDISPLLKGLLVVHGAQAGPAVSVDLRRMLPTTLRERHYDLCLVTLSQMHPVSWGGIMLMVEKVDPPKLWVGGRRDARCGTSQTWT